MNMRTLDFNQEISNIGRFIHDYIHSSGFSKAVIGLSGGIDSSLSAALCVKALGKDNVIGVMLPYKSSSPASYEDALLLAEQLGIAHQKIDITPMVDSYFDNLQPDADILRRGNWMARIRMCVLYDLSAQNRALVVGTSNRTELLVGYFTQFGDGACAFEPIGHLYKTEVWQMAALLGIPEKIIKKTPTADLWANQTDEGELGLFYPQLDEILYLITEQQLQPDAIIARGFTPEQVQKVQNLMQRSQFKRMLPPIPGGND
jgi:NAD+ synthase